MCIRDRCTPDRWKRFDAELEFVWTNLLNALDQKNHEQFKCFVLIFFYYWVTFAPLTRGSASTGYSAMFALMRGGLNMAMTKGMPPSCQLDWEAILCSSPEEFLAKHKDDILSRFTRSNDDDNEGSVVLVSSVLKSLRCVLSVLNFCDEK